MIKIKTKKDEFVIEGSFDLGYMGVYRDTQIEIIDSISEVREWNIVTNNFASTYSDDELCEFLEFYFNSFEKKVKENRKLLNNNFLLKIYLWMEACGTEFWNVPQITNKSYLLQNIDDVNVYEPLWSQMEQIREEYEDSDRINKTDVETLLVDKLPLFNFKALIAGIVPEVLTLNDSGISFQCSDSIKNFEYKILCGAYDLIDENLVFTDFHNF